MFRDKQVDRQSRPRIFKYKEDASSGGSSVPPHTLQLLASQLVMRTIQGYEYGTADVPPMIRSISRKFIRKIEPTMMKKRQIKHSNRSSQYFLMLSDSRLFIPSYDKDSVRSLRRSHICLFGRNGSSTA
uniref:Uncharacterized protein n=1 Tax=Romanomermis culicivorax TaxID=13658 RepID=A0A915HZS1_ROMCU